jgi:hypothetical protein
VSVNDRPCHTAPAGRGWWQCVEHMTRFPEDTYCPLVPETGRGKRVTLYSVWVWGGDDWRLVHSTTSKRTAEAIAGYGGVIVEQNIWVRKPRPDGGA